MPNKRKPKLSEITEILGVAGAVIVLVFVVGGFLSWVDDTLYGKPAKLRAYSTLMAELDQRLVGQDRAIATFVRNSIESGTEPNLGDDPGLAPSNNTQHKEGNRG